MVALGRDEVEWLRFRYDHQRRAGLDTGWLSGREVRDLEPGLRPSVAAGIRCAGDHQVDPRRLIPALVRALHARGGLLFENCPVTALETSRAGVISGLVTAAGPCRADVVVVAGGVWSADGLLPGGIDLPLRPLKGQALALRAPHGTGAALPRGLDRAGSSRPQERWPADRRRHDGGCGLQRRDHRRRRARVARRRPSRASGERGDGDRSDLVRLPADHRGRRADPRHDRRARDCSSPPAITATASCSRRSPPWRSRNS